MCGIAGEVRFDGRDADVAAVARINEAMHRVGRTDAACTRGHAPRSATAG